MKIESHTWDLPPEAAVEYFDEIVKDFERRGQEDFLKILDWPRPIENELLAVLRYVQTREVTGHESRLREIFTTNWKGKDADRVYQACLDALVTTTKDRRSTAEFLVYVGSLRRPLPSTTLCADGLKRLGRPAHAALLSALEKCENGASRRKLALLLKRVSQVRSPQPLRFWKEAGDSERQKAVDLWRTQIAARTHDHP